MNIISGSKGALLSSFTLTTITDLVDYVPIGDGLDGPGNFPMAS